MERRKHLPRFILIQIRIKWPIWEKVYSMKSLYTICSIKPKGVISATEDDRPQTVIDLLDDTARRKEVFPVGRLDIDTHGLLLLTNR